MSDAFRAISAGKATIDGLRLLTQYASEIKDVQKHGEFMRIIGETNLELAETQNRLAEQIRQNNDLREEISRLKKEIETLRREDSKPVFRDGLYYLNDQEPCCTGCYDSQEKLIRVTKLSLEAQMLGIKYRCPVCRASYNGTDAS